MKTILLTLCLAASALTGSAAHQRYDLEHHYYHPKLLEYLATRAAAKNVPYYDADSKTLYLREGEDHGTNIVVGISLAPSLNNPGGSMEADLCSITAETVGVRLGNMNAANVGVAVLSSSAAIEDLPKDKAIEFARLSNDAVAALVKDNPSRFLGAATLPTPYVEEAKAELARCINELGFEYWHTHSNYLPDDGMGNDRRTEHLYDEKYESLLRLANDLRCPVYVHPHAQNNANMTDAGYLYGGPALGFGQDVMKTTLRLIMKGTLDENPHLRLLIGHLGEYYPYVLERMDERFMSAPDPENVRMKHPVAWYFQNRQIFVTTSGNESDEAFRCTVKALGVNSIIFGSDYPYEIMANESQFVDGLVDKDIISESDLERICIKNAEEFILRSKVKVDSSAGTADDPWIYGGVTMWTNRVGRLYVEGTGEPTGFIWDSAPWDVVAVSAYDLASGVTGFPKDSIPEGKTVIERGDAAYKAKRRFDLECHYYLPEFLDYLATRTEVPRYDRKTMMLEYRDGVAVALAASLNDVANSSMYAELCDLGEIRLRFMDQAGIDVAVLSCSPCVEDLPEAESIYWSRRCNDAITEAVRRHPDRFLGSAILPTPYVNAAKDELRRCVSDLGFKYWHTHSNYLPKRGAPEFIYDAKYEPLMALANVLKCAIYVHPHNSDDADMKESGFLYSGSGLGFSLDAMRSTLRIIMKGTLDRYPNLTMIVGHLGEYYPFVLERMDTAMVHEIDPDYILNDKKFASYFREGRVLVTTSGNTQKTAYECCRNELGREHVMFGSDYPYENYREMADVMDESAEYANPTAAEEEKQAVYHVNPVNFLKIEE